MDHLELFTDGGAITIGDKFYGSSAYVIRFKNKYFTFSDPVTEGTNNKFELNAIRLGLKAITSNWGSLQNIEVWIVSDSQYSISCITQWFDGWKKVNGIYVNKQGKPVSHIDQILEIRNYLKMIPNYKFIKIKSHIGTEIENSYKEFLNKNKVKVSFTEYLLLVRFNEMCDNKITSAFNLKRKYVAKQKGVELV